MMSVFAKRFFDFWLVNFLYEPCLIIKSIKPDIYVPKPLEKWLYPMNYSVRNNQKTSVGIAFIASRLCKSFAPVTYLKLKCGNITIAFYKNIICYSKTWNRKLRAANAKYITLQYPMFKKFVLKQSFGSFISDICRQICARIMRTKRNIFNSVHFHLHISKYINFRGFSYA